MCMSMYECEETVDFQGFARLFQVVATLQNENRPKEFGSSGTTSVTGT